MLTFLTTTAILLPNRSICTRMPFIYHPLMLSSSAVHPIFIQVYFVFIQVYSAFIQVRFILIQVHPIFIQVHAASIKAHSAFIQVRFILIRVQFILSSVIVILFGGLNLHGASSSFRIKMECQICLWTIFMFFITCI